MSPSPGSPLHEGVMLPFDIREPINAWSHGAGMMMALPVTWLLWKQCGKRNPCESSKICQVATPCVAAKRRCGAAAPPAEGPLALGLRPQPHILLRRERHVSWAPSAGRVLEPVPAARSYRDLLADRRDLHADRLVAVARALAVGDPDDGMDHRGDECRCGSGAGACSRSGSRR